MRACCAATILSTAALVACGGGDAGPTDAAPPDARSADTGTADAAREDAGRDAGRPDASAPDAGPPPPPCRETTGPSWDLEAGRWSSAFGSPGISSPYGAAARVYSSRWHGGELYIAGAFSHAGPVEASNVAAWSQSSGWRALGAGLEEAVRHVAVAADGTVYAATPANVTSGEGTVHRFRDASWEAIGVASTPIDAMEVTQDGGLLVSGYFNMIDGVAASRLARWDGTGWAAVDHYGWTVEAIHADATSTCIGGRRLARFAYVACQDPVGTDWTLYSLPEQPGPPYPTPVTDILRDETGAVFAAGALVLDGDRDVGGVARWDGSAWSLLEPGLAPSGTSDPTVYSGTFDATGGLWVVGSFYTIGAFPGVAYAGGVARHDGTRWHSGGSLDGREAGR